MKAILAGTGVLIGLCAFGLWRQRMERAELQAGVTLSQLEQQELATLHAQRQRLLTVAVSDSELRRLRADRAAMARLRDELDQLKDRVATKRAAPPAAAALPADVLPPPRVTEGPVSENFLRNAGRATPADALETALWAATGGDIDTLAGTLVLEHDARLQAERILAAATPDLREQYPTPEHLIALLTAREIPLAGIQIMPPKKEDPAGTRLLVRMPGGDGKPRMIAVSLRQLGSEWKMVVPASAVEKYGRMLSGANPPAPSN